MVGVLPEWGNTRLTGKFCEQCICKGHWTDDATKKLPCQYFLNCQRPWPAGCSHPSTAPCASQPPSGHHRVTSSKPRRGSPGTKTPPHPLTWQLGANQLRICEGYGQPTVRPPHHTTGKVNLSSNQHPGPQGTWQRVHPGNGSVYLGGRTKSQTRSITETTW